MKLGAAFAKTAPTSIADLKAMQERVEALAAQVSPAVVAVEVGRGSGSGVVITADGLVLTAGHVCGAADRDVTFTFPDGKTAKGKTLGLDRDSDTGLMRITDPGPWVHAPTGDLNQDQIGDWVLALGHPGGFDKSRSLVVRLGRILRITDGALGTDCTIAPGDSGGPLFDMSGRIIGIHTAISESLADNFHVPINRFYDNWEAMVKDANPVTRAPPPPLAYMGAIAADDSDGCRISQVTKDGPAFTAGLKTDDLVLKVNGREIVASASFRRWIRESEPGETLKLEIKRGEKVMSLRVKLDTVKRPK